MKPLFRPFGKLLVSLLVVMVFLPTLTSGHESGDGISGGGEKGILFIAMGPSNNFVMIDIATEKVMRAVAGPVNPHGIAVTPDGKYAYLTSRNPEKKKNSTSRGDYPVSVVAVNTGKIVTTIDVGGESHHARMSPGGKRVYVTVPSVEGMVVIDTTTNKVHKTIETGFKANSTATSPDGRLIYVVNKGDDTLSVINGETLEVIKNIEVGKGPDHLAVSPDGNFIYLTATFANEVWALRASPLEVIAKVPVGQGPHGIAVSSDGKQIFTASRGDATFSVFAAPELRKIHSFKLGKGPGHVSI
ncbi:MAG: beta-propeller fold lactonase family protein, partial [candidate division Zixibacteria bacterium]|nr:beta-propeller fold lactonase family protein [candidate division Zixibacteria bacterium]